MSMTGNWPLKLFILVLFPIFSTHAQYTWQQEAPAQSPVGRTRHGMTFDTDDYLTIVFGGEDINGTRLQDTWTYNGTTWTQVNTATVPARRAAAALEYDHFRDEAVMFGGALNVGVSAQTWIFDGADWTLASPGTSPSARFGHVMTFDTARTEMLLFGGVDGSSVLNNETWTWNGTNWTQENPAASPPARSNASLVFDSNRGVAVLFGGNDGTNDLSDTWEWNGTNWTQISPVTSPST